MSIITKPSSIEKDAPAVVTLNKSNLALIPSVLNDPYFSDQDNWKNVIIYYKSSIGNQKELLKFDATLSSPTASFLVSDKARDVFEVQKIIVQDFDGGSIVVPRSELNESEFDVDMGAVVSTVATFELFQNYPIYSPSVNPTLLIRVENDLYTPISVALSTQSLGSLSSGVGNFDLTFNMESLSNSGGYGTSIGILFSDSDPNTINLAEVNSNYESSSYMLSLDFLANMATKTIGTAGYTTTTGFSGPKLIRLLQEGDNQLKIYQNGNLINTITIPNVSKPYSYPFLRSSWQHQLTSLTIVE